MEPRIVVPKDVPKVVPEANHCTTTSTTTTTTTTTTATIAATTTQENGLVIVSRKKKSQNLLVKGSSQTQDNDSAIATFERAIRLDDENVAAHFELAQALEIRIENNANMDADAKVRTLVSIVNHYQKYRKSFPDLWRTYERLAINYMKLFEFKGDKACEYAGNIQVCQNAIICYEKILACENLTDIHRYELSTKVIQAREMLIDKLKQKKEVDQESLDRQERKLNGDKTFCEGLKPYLKQKELLETVKRIVNNDRGYFLDNFIHIPRIWGLFQDEWKPWSAESTKLTFTNLQKMAGANLPNTISRHFLFSPEFTPINRLDWAIVNSSTEVLSQVEAEVLSQGKTEGLLEEGEVELINLDIHQKHSI